MKIIDELHERRFYPHHTADTPDNLHTLAFAGRIRVIHNPFFKDVYAKVLVNYSFGQNGLTREQFRELSAAIEAAFDYAESLLKEGV